MQNKGKYYITTAIAYTSGKPHIGNTYEIILADCIARYKRADGYDVHFQTGSDEHGQKIESRAAVAGKTPKEFVDGVAGEIKRLWDLVNTSYDRFIRTTDEDHERQVQKIFKKLYDQGDIYLGYYEGMYCRECEAFYTASQVVDGKYCPVCGGEVHQAKEDAYFFRMKKYADRLIEHINTHPEFIQPVSRKNEMMNNFLLPGLQDLCVSRSSFTWGIPVDFAPGHVVYVWLDALSNYITGIGYDADGNSSDLYKKIVGYMGDAPSRYADEFNDSVTKAVNRITASFSERFVLGDGSIDWDAIVDYNSGSQERKSAEEMTRTREAVVRMMRENPMVTKKALAEGTRCGMSRLNKVIDSLVEDGTVSAGHAGRARGWTVSAD